MDVLLLYVDDIILACSSTAFSDSIIGFLMNSYPVKDLGILRYFLGIEAEFQNNSQQLLLTQNKYTLEMLEKYDLLNCKPSKTPVTKGPRLFVSTGTPLSNITEYRSMVGGLQYLTMTRPNICFNVNYVAQFMQSPTDEHLLLVKRILRYLKGTLGTGVLLSAGDITAISAYSDSDWAGCPDTRRSIYGMCVFLGSSLVSWSSKKQPTISKSSAEAEYKSLAITAAEVVWISFLLQELDISLATPFQLYCDNVSANSLATNPVFHARTKYIEIDYHFIRELVSSGFIQVSYVSSANQLADLFTKGLVHCVFLTLAGKLLCLHQYQLKGDCKNSECIMSESVSERASEL
ncbi:uncharacterized protein LOC113316190 [Papaver somniferum]|uniref:uncharacterized protein LOC113316190 n=1 Tax=Papaver somniferum TaxID=3469 RepID=UPI000E6FEFDC|nr:uncharacterized protein LOC113316190 [Papaver somniferum]